MENLLSVAFEAHHDQKNYHRRYEVVIGRDLLNDWTVAIRYGRIGKKPQEQRHASKLPEEMRMVVRDRLRRRLSAPKRIGCSYRLYEMNAAPGFNSTSWLPGDLMAMFFTSN